MIYEEIINIVKLAGELILQAQEDVVAVYQKEGIYNYVTKCDKDVQSYLIRNLRVLIPEAHFLAEEDGIRQELGEDYCFIIDPMDGTTNFISGYKECCISVGLAMKGKMQFGCVYNPYTREMYSAVKGEGARLNGVKILSSQRGLAENLAAYGCSRRHGKDAEQIFDYVKRLYCSSLGVRQSGSSAWDICRVASGANGAFIELKLEPWNYAAASLIVMEAGGFISTVEGGFVTLDRPCSILAAGRKCWKEAMQLLK